MNLTLHLHPAPLIVLVVVVGAYWGFRRPQSHRGLAEEIIRQRDQARKETMENVYRRHYEQDR